MANDEGASFVSALLRSATLHARIRALAAAFWVSPVRNAIGALAVGVGVVLILNAFGQLALNRWNQPFFDSIERRDTAAFRYQLSVFVVIAGSLLCLNVAQSWLNQMLKLKLRQGLSLDLYKEWMKPLRAFRLARAGEIGVNPDQRLHEDARHLCEVSTDLAIGLLQAAILLASFVGVLWALSSDFVFDIAGRSIAIPGYMVWAAVAYALVASLLSWWMGRRLIALNMERYAREADLRADLMRVGEYIEAIGPARGEETERGRLVSTLDAVLAVTKKLVFAQTRLTWVTAAYGWSLLVVPVLVAAPVYFSGRLTFGGLMMAVGAFNQVQSSLRWFIDNFGTIADWWATFLRVAAVHEAIRAMDEPDADRARIEIRTGEPGRILIDGLVVDGGDALSRLDPPKVVITAASRVLILGDPGAGKTLIFNALAGLWPFGSGLIELPPGESVMFLAARPYLPTGPLRAAVSYPDPPRTGPAADAAINAALTAMGLGRLAPLLDVDGRWERELSEEDQQRLAFVRLAIHQPDYVVIDELLDSLDAMGRPLALTMFRTTLAKTALVAIGRADEDRDLFDQVVRIEREKAPAASPMG